MIDVTAIAGMVFSLLVLMMIGGCILLFPLTRRLGAYLEQRLEQGKGATDQGEIRQLRAAVGALQSEVERLAERQEFTDSLLSAPSRSSSGGLPHGSGAGSSKISPPASED